MSLRKLEGALVGACKSMGELGVGFGKLMVGF